MTTSGELIILIDKYQHNSTIQLEVFQISELAWSSDANNVNVHNILIFTTGGLSSKVVEPGNNSSQWIVLDMAHSPDSNTPLLYLAKYKIVLIEEFSGVKYAKDSLYIDYRTSDLPEAVLWQYGVGQPDIIFRYDDSTDVLSYDDSTPGPINETYWDLKDHVDLNQEDLEPGVPASFNLTSQSGHPKLTWSHSAYDEDYWTGYALYRCIAPIGSKILQFRNLKQLLNIQHLMLTHM